MVVAGSLEDDAYGALEAMKIIGKEPALGRGVGQRLLEQRNNDRPSSQSSLLTSWISLVSWILQFSRSIR